MNFHADLPMRAELKTYSMSKCDFEINELIVSKHGKFKKIVILVYFTHKYS